MQFLKSKRAWKFIGGFALLVIGALALVYGTIYFSPEAREERAAQEYFENLEEQYRTDTYGGETPEETLELFIQALEEENIELASKYFLPEDREEIKNYLKSAQEEAGNFNRFIEDSNKLELSKKEVDKAFYVITNKNNVVEVQVILKKNQNDVWKITDL